MSFYSPLFSVDVEHAFWARPATALTCLPTSETADWIRRRDLLVRPQRNGVAVFCEASRRSILLDDCAPGTALLSFKWYARDPLFSQYTLPLVPAQGKILYARSGVAVATESGSKRLCLHANEFVDVELIHAMTAPQVARHLDPRDMLRKPVLVAEIDLADHVAAKAAANGGADQGKQADASVDYYARFDVRSSVWKYYFLSDADNDMESLAVIDLDEAVRFVAAEPEILPGNRRALVFMSDGEISMQQKYPQRFQLRTLGAMGERVLIRRLPNADVSKVTQEMIGSKAALVSEIYIN